MADPADVATALQVGVGSLVRRLRQIKAVDGELTNPETVALVRLDRGGPTTASALAKAEQISAQSMGSTLAGLQTRGFVEREADAHDRRRVVLSLSPAGAAALATQRTARTQRLTAALTMHFSSAQHEQLAQAAALIEALVEVL